MGGKVILSMLDNQSSEELMCGNCGAVDVVEEYGDLCEDCKD